MNTKHIIKNFFAGILLLAPGMLYAQQDQDVAAAARKAQEAKKTAPKAKLTIDNDNLGSLKGTVSVVGQQPAPPAEKDKSAVPAETPTGAVTEKAPVKDEAYWRQQFADANKKLDDDAHELDILQREYNLKQEQFYTDPMAALKQDYSRQDLNETKQKIDDKTASVAMDKQNISDLEDALRAAGGEPGWATPPSTPASAEAPAQAQAPAQASSTSMH
jgi:chromosome segregation ATPase